MRPDGLTARGWRIAAVEVWWYENSARKTRGLQTCKHTAREGRLWRLLLARIEARARREAGRE